MIAAMFSPWLLLALVVSADRPVTPATPDIDHPTCLALASPDADALYLVPRTVCDSRACVLRLELQKVRARGAAHAPEVLAEGYPTAGAALWTGAVRAKVEAVVSTFRWPCKTTPIEGPHKAGDRRFTLAPDRGGSWWARGDNGREQPLSRLGAGGPAPVVVDGFPASRAWGFARAIDSDGNLVLQSIALGRLAAPPFAELVAKPQTPVEGLSCFGWDKDGSAMLVRSHRRTCTGDACRDETWLVRVTARGAEDVQQLEAGTTPGAAVAGLAALELGCTDGELDEPVFGGRTLMVMPSLSETAIDLSVFEPRERHWSVGALKTSRGPHGEAREGVAQVFWNPEVPVLVLRVAAPSGERDRFVWVDLASKGLAPRAAR